MTRQAIARALIFALLTLALAGAAFLAPAPVASRATAATIDAAVLDALAASPDGQASFIVVFEARADLSAADAMQDWTARGRYVMERLQAVAERSQRDTRGRLSTGVLPGRVTKHQAFWIANVITVTGDRRAAEALARTSGVAAIMPEMKIDPPEPPITKAQAPDADSTWGIEKIGANQVWDAVSGYGKTGGGTVIGLVDTGVQWDHAALKASYRGWNGSAADHNYNWWNPAGLCADPKIPCDPNGHGTHTTGIAAGGNSPAQGPIGVAPGAKWIMAAGCCASNASLLSALQWMAAPTDLNGANPQPGLRPNVVNNSWGGPGGSKIFYDAISNLAASGIVPVFSAGNSGSACGTLGSPGDNTNAFNVGSTASTDTISSFSSRGPNPFTGEPAPDVSAPGESIYSSYNDGGYTVLSGTSMAAPHVSGSVALLLSVEPDLAGKVAEVEEILRKTGAQLASSQTCGGSPGSQIPNSVFGWGRINVKAAADLVVNSGVLSGSVTGTGGAPISGAVVSIARNGKTITQPTDASGNYSFTIGAGSYEMSVKAFGYNTVSAAVAVTKDAVTDRDFALTASTVGTIGGVILEGGDPAKPVAGALVQLLPAATGVSAITGVSGAYALTNVPFGSYSVRMGAPGYATMTAAVTVDGAETLNFSPAAVADYLVGDGGDTCSVDYNWIDVTSGAAHNLADDANVNVALPWSFTFYGLSYNSLYIGSNGLVSFGTGQSKWGGIVPFEGPPNNQIIGLGDDLNPEGGTQGKIYSKDLGDGRFVVQYDQVQHWESGDPETFEIVLNKNDGSILALYKTVSWPDYSNAGIENADGSRGILYASGLPTPLKSSLAVRYIPFTGKPPVCAPAVAPAVTIQKAGSDASLSWQHTSPNTSYQVWRDSSPYFLPTGEGTLAQTLAALPGSNTWTDGGKIGNAELNYFWIVRGILAGGASGPSNRVGEFDFPLVKGG